MQTEFSTWRVSGSVILGGSLAVLLVVHIVGAGTVTLFWLLAFTLPVGPAVLLADLAGRLLGWRHRGRLFAACVLWLVLPLSALVSETGWPPAEWVAIIDLALAAGLLLMIGLASSLRAGGWLLNRRRRRLGLPSIAEAASRRLRVLRPLEQASVVLGALALTVMAAGLLVDTQPAVVPSGAMGVLALALTRFWLVLQGVAVSVLAGAIVLYVQARGGLAADSDDDELGGESMTTGRGSFDRPGPTTGGGGHTRTSRVHIGRLAAAAALGVVAGLLVRNRGG